MTNFSTAARYICDTVQTGTDVVLRRDPVADFMTAILG